VPSSLPLLTSSLSSNTLPFIGDIPPLLSPSLGNTLPACLLSQLGNTLPILSTPRKPVSPPISATPYVSSSLQARQDPASLLLSLHHPASLLSSPLLFSLQLPASPLAWTKLCRIKIPTPFPKHDVAGLCEAGLCRCSTVPSSLPLLTSSLSSNTLPFIGDIPPLLSPSLGNTLPPSFRQYPASPLHLATPCHPAYPFYLATANLSSPLLSSPILYSPLLPSPLQPSPLISATLFPTQIVAGVCDASRCRCSTVSSSLPLLSSPLLSSLGNTLPDIFRQYPASPLSAIPCLSSPHLSATPCRSSPLGNTLPPCLFSQLGNCQALLSRQ